MIDLEFPDTQGINAVLGACDKAKCWTKALQLWKAMVRKNLSFGCGAGGSGTLADLELGKLGTSLQATSPDLITYNTAIAACFGAPSHVASDAWFF